MTEPTDLQRFAERLARELETMALGVEVVAPEATQVKAALNYVASAVREAAKEET